MSLIICGHQRSSTTLLQKLLDGHPEMAITSEFGNYFDVNKPIDTYRRLILYRWRRAQNRSFLRPERRWFRFRLGETRTGVQSRRRLALRVCRSMKLHMVQNLVLVTRYLLNLRTNRYRIADVKTIDAALESVFSEARIVGDKHPDYVFAMDKLAMVDGLSRLIIYRDVRDVTYSALKAYTVWGQWWAEELSRAGMIAERWVRAIELMERYANKAYVIRYEDLVSSPLGILMTSSRLQPRPWSGWVIPSERRLYNWSLSSSHVSVVAADGTTPNLLTIATE